MSVPDDGTLCPWRQRSGQMYLTDREIIDWLDTTEGATPRDIAEGRRRENVLRLQCRNMVNIGLLSNVAHDTFKVSNEGKAFLRGETSYPSNNGQFAIDEILRCPDWRLTKFDELDSQDIKIINKNFFEDEDNDYRFINESPSLTLQRIRNVQDCKLNRIIEEFPRTEPLPQQCAHWMRAFSGLHMFPDANHRTGMAALYGLLNSNNLAPSPSEWPDKSIDRVVLQSKIARGLHSDIRFNTFWLRDELYASWHRYFRNLLCNVCNRMSIKPSVNDLREIVEFGRRKGI